jgi:hypothetical protein
MGREGGTFSHPILSQRVWLLPGRPLETRSGANRCHSGAGSSASHQTSTTRAIWPPPTKSIVLMNYNPPPIPLIIRPMSHNTRPYTAVKHQIETINHHMALIYYTHYNQINHCADPPGPGWGARGQVRSPNSVPAFLVAPREAPVDPIRGQWVPRWGWIEH